MNKSIFKLFVSLMLFCVATTYLNACIKPENTEKKAEKIYTTVVEIEKYGHAVLDITAADFARKGYELGDIVSIKFDSVQWVMPYFDGYYSDPRALMLRGRTTESKIAICINHGNFSEETGIAVGDTVELNMVEKGGMLEVQELFSLQYSLERKDFSDDHIFANFRSITLGDIGKGKLYRSSSPINNKYCRAPFASMLIEESKINTILNLADAKEDIEFFLNQAEFGTTYYSTLYQEGKVYMLDLAADFFNEDFSKHVVRGLTFLSKNAPPYCIHCTEGKDRTGFIMVILEALMGADLQEIIRDYMLSFYNYYGITKEKEPDRYQIVLETNLIPMLCHITDADDISQISQMDLESKTEEYLLKMGMAEEDIATLKEKLR